MNKAKDIIRLRLQNQLLSAHPFKSVVEAVRWLGAVQAQDYLGSLWAIGQRLSVANESMIEKAIAERQIVRSWPMRGTLHLTAAEDLRWIQSLLAPRIIKKAASIYRQSELDDKIFNKAAKIITKSLESETVQTRDQLYDRLERSKISTNNTRGLHILGWMAQKGLICLAPRQGKQTTFTLLDHWIPSAKSFTKEESFAELAMRYFRSHGPATVQDFAWWAGLTIKESIEALALVKTNFSEMKFDNQNFWFEERAVVRSKPEVFLLPSYDEYTVGYKDRSAFLDEKHMAKARNGIFTPCILVNGKIEGTWKRTLSKTGAELEFATFEKLTAAQQRLLLSAGKQYTKFLSKSR